MSLDGTFRPPPAEDVYSNINEIDLHHGQVSNVHTASMGSLDQTFLPPPAEAALLSNINGSPPPPQAEAAEAPLISNINGSNLQHGQEIGPITEQNTHFGSALNQENEMMNLEAENLLRSKRRKLKSKVWDDFTKYEGEDGKEWAKCNHCKKGFVGSSKSGTTHLKNHLVRCPSKRNPSRGADKSMETSACLISSAVIRNKSKVDQELNDLNATRAIIKYWGSSVKSIKDDVLNVYREEKKQLRRHFNELPCRFNVRMEFYNCFKVCCIALYFIDDSWELKKRIIHLQEDKYRGDFFEILKCSLQDCNMDKNICSTVGHIFEDSVFDEEFIKINNWLSLQSSLPFVGNCIPVSCFLDKIASHIMRSRSTRIIFNKAWKLLQYFKKMSSNENNFQLAIDKAKSMGKKVTTQGIPEPWHLNFDILEWVMGSKEAFSELELVDADFKSINFIEEDWDTATILYDCWKVLKDGAGSLFGNKTKTANGCFPVICDISLKLLQWEKSHNLYVDDRAIASWLKEYLHEYWSNSELVLGITVVLDPRFKMEIVECWCKEIYGSEADTHLKRIIDDFTNVYNEYAKCSNNFKSSPSCESSCHTNFSTPCKMLDAMGRPSTSSQRVNDVVLPKSELDCYLKDTKFPAVEEFDILAWWHFNSPIFPVLSRMARDFLAIPLFVPVRLLDSPLKREICDIFNHNGLDDDIKQALACTKVWLSSPETK